ncbi:hypothetical protein [Kitasatospora kifunensis]|uniref:Uncharacterized protein n=1 Tax=Kitasatospora kifunensis TaxID=58351 RepID=A0A7W7R5U6_KITKI|nr:hypothetical protein [Kitasatospora kifunensis]MBB4925804.1 hypothetical protein [Kitasatospora kifunensis]
MNEEFDELPDDEFRFTLSAELAALTPPPLGDLVAVAAQRGRRTRRRRTVFAVAGSVTAVVGIAALLAGPLAGGGPGNALHERVAAAADPAPPSTSPTDIPSSGGNSGSNSTDGPPVPTDGPALLAASLNALPIGGLAGNYATNDNSLSLGVRFNLTSAPDTGMITIMISKAKGALHCSGGFSCPTNAGGLPYSVIRQPGNSVEAMLVTVQHPDNTLVSIEVSTAKAWDPVTQTNPPARAALTLEQAVALGSNPALSTQMAADFVQAADAKYPNLPTFT